MVKTLEDFLTFHCAPASLGADLQYAALEERLKPALNGGEGQGTLADFAFLLTHTDGIDFRFDGTEKKPLHDFRDTWLKWKTLSPEDVWAWRLAIPWPIINLWQQACVAAQELFKVPVEQLPTEALTPEQRLEAARPDSPLARSASSSPKES